MDNFFFLKKSPEIEALSKSLGFARTYFQDDVLFYAGGTKKELLQRVQAAHQKRLLIVYHPLTEEMLRFALERTAVDIILGVESIHPKDSLHFLRGGLDQVLCAIAAKNKKIIAFSVQEILNSKNKPQLLGRMALNLALCKKYKVKTIFSNFSAAAHSLWSANDIITFRQALEKQRNIYK